MYVPYGDERKMTAEYKVFRYVHTYPSFERIFTVSYDCSKEGGMVLLEILLGAHQQSPYVEIRARIFQRLWSSGIGSKASITPAYVAWRAGTAQYWGNVFNAEQKSIDARPLLSVRDIVCVLCSHGATKNFFWSAWKIVQNPVARD